MMMHGLTTLNFKIHTKIVDINSIIQMLEHRHRQCSVLTNLLPFSYKIKHIKSVTWNSGLCRWCPGVWIRNGKC